MTAIVTKTPVNQPVVSIHELWEHGLVEVYRDQPDQYMARTEWGEWPITAHAYLSLVIPDTPAFWSQEQLQRHGVGSAPGFDRRRFAMTYDLLPEEGRIGDEEKILMALNQRRGEFLLLAKLCWQQNNLGWRLRLTWWHLWLREWLTCGVAWL